MTSCLTKDYVDSHSGSETDTRVFTPPGYRWAQRTAGFLGARPIRENINACHLLANQLTGSGTDPRNLATCARGANAKQLGSQQGDNNMAKYEADIAAAVQAGQDVYYSVTPRYSGRRIRHPRTGDEPGRECWNIHQHFHFQHPGRPQPRHVQRPGHRSAGTDGIDGMTPAGRTRRHRDD
ncbi:DNA/RNA non-specific endonuclease [Streptomyces sp. NPDC093795]|uniref:DNA/RNA non-specific endonuclease n=1 Tax=Streptomyces sp. NPDC093795 TaxID=3366051 RepID=UPI003804FED1